MSVDIVPFELRDVVQMDVNERYSFVRPWFCRYLLKLNILVGPWAYTAWNQYGIPVASCGILEDGMAWAFISPAAKSDIVAVTRYVRRILNEYHDVKGPVFADIDETHVEAVRWAKLLGFKPFGEGSLWRYEGSSSPQLYLPLLPASKSSRA